MTHLHTLSLKMHKQVNAILKDLNMGLQKWLSEWLRALAVLPEDTTPTFGGSQLIAYNSSARRSNTLLWPP